MCLRRRGLRILPPWELYLLYQIASSMSSSSKTPTQSNQTLESPMENNSKTKEETPQNLDGDLKSEGQEQENTQNLDGDSKSEAQEEEGECGFCLFMKGGGCKESFIGWEKCIEEAEKNKEDIVDKCFEVTSVLKKCMDAHSDYYHPILQAEKEAEALAVQELEIEKGNEGVESNKNVENTKEGVEESKESDENSRH